MSLYKKTAAILLLSFCNILSIGDNAYIVDGSNRSTVITNFTSLYGSKLTANVEEIFNINFFDGIPSSDVTTTTSGLGSVTHDSVNKAVTISIGSGSVASESAVVSKAKSEQAPFTECYLYAAVIFDDCSDSDISQWVGLLTDSNGIAVGFNGSQFSILSRSDSVDTIVASSEFNVDKLDGNGISGVLLNPSYINAFRISFGWLASSPIVFEIQTPDGSWHPFHIIRNLNFISTTLLKEYKLPFTAKIKKVSSDNDVEMKLLACVAGKITSSKSASGYGGNAGGGDAGGGDGDAGDSVDTRNFSVVRNSFKISSNKAIKPILSIKNKTTFGGAANTIKPVLSYFNLSNDKKMRFWLVKNGTLSGSNFSDVDSNSVVEEDTSATSISGGTNLLTFWSKSDSFKDFFLQSNSVSIGIDPGDTVSLVAQALTSNVTFDTTVNWNESH